MLLKNTGVFALSLFAAPLLSAASKHSSSANDDELSRIREQFIATLIEEQVDDSEVKRFIETIQHDGTWSDVDYSSQRGGNWETRIHLKRLETIAQAFQNQLSQYYHDQQVAQLLLKGVEHWVENDYQNPNWWQMKIGAPTNLGHIIILLDNQISETLIQRAKRLLDRSTIEMTGQNRVWQSAVVFMRGLLTNDQEEMAQASEAIWSELKISNEEGIQPDYSFHQHGPQLQFGNYGRSFGESMVRWASILRNTQFEMPKDKVRILGDYLLNGPRWSLWKKRMDLNVCGRQFSPETPSNPVIGYTETKAQLTKLSVIDDERAPLFRQVAKDNDHPIGHQNYWRTAFSIHRRPQWYSSLRMSSTYVIGTETANYENLKGRLFGDGCHLYSVSGREYEDIAPLWNWRRLPGITADQNIIELYPTSFNTEYGRSAFAGGISAGETGVSAMKFMREGIMANKSWFFEDDAIICLGSDIKGYSHGDVFTSIQQSLYMGNAISNNGKIASGKHLLQAGSWVHHDHIGYQLLSDSTCLIEYVEGNWNTMFHKYSDIPTKGEIFSLWINHGKSPTNQDYAYVIYPAVKAKDMPDRIAKNSFKIIGNTKRVAAIESNSGVKAVFFKPAKISLSSEITISASKACIISLKGRKMMVCDPARQYEYIEFVVGEQSYNISLPQGDDLGKPVEFNL